MFPQQCFRNNVSSFAGALRRHEIQFAPASLGGIRIKCLTVAYRRLKTMEIFKPSGPKVVAYGRRSFTRSGRLQEVSTVVN